MKKLLYSGLMALMMLFAMPGIVRAEGEGDGGETTTPKPKVSVTLSATTWDGTTESALPTFTVTAPEGITIGTAEGNVVVKVDYFATINGSEVEFDQVLESTTATMVNKDNKLAEATWTLSYSLYKGNDQTATFDDAEIDMENSTMQFVVGNASTKIPVQVQLIPNKAAEGSVDEAAYSVSIQGETELGLGTTENALAVLVTFTKGETTKTTLLTSTSGDLNLKTIGLTVGEWTVSYKFIKGNGTATTNEELTNVEASAQSTATFTVIPAAPTFTPAAGAILARTPVTVKSTTTTYKVYYRLGTKQGEYTTNDTNSVKFPINAATTVYACAVTKDGASSDTVEAAYTIKDCTFTGTLSLLSPADKNGSYTTPDTVYNDAAPEFEAKVEGLEIETPTFLRYRVYQSVDGKDTLMDEGLAFEETFSPAGYGNLKNGIYKVVVDIVENGPYDMDNERIRVAYTKPDGTAVEVVRYIQIAAPAWTLESPKLEVVEDEEGEETIVPIKLLPGEGLEVVVKAENCEKLYGTGEGQLLISKRVCANSLLAMPAVARQMNPCYEIIDTVLGEDGRIRFSLPEGWVDSIRKVVTTNVDKLLAMYEEEDGPMSDAEKAEFYATYGLAEGEDLSDCSVDLQVYEWVDMSDYDMDPMLMPSEKYYDMFVNVPFSVADTTLAPTFSVDGGAVLKGSELVIVANIATDTVYYRLNEGAFQKAEKVNIAKIAINEASKVEAYAIGRNNRKSPTADASFTVFSLPTLTVEAAGKNEKKVDTVVFDSIATFKVKVEGKNLAEGDALSNYTISAELYTQYSFDTGAVAPDLTTYSYNVTDTLVEFVGVYNGKYVVRFFLNDTTNKDAGEVEGTLSEVRFNVTHYTAPVYVDPTFDVTVAGKNEMKEKTVVFDGPAAFKMKVGEMSKGDSLKIAAVIYTKINFDTFGEPITTNSYEAIDEDAEFLGIYNGEYAVRFELQRYSLMLRDFSAITDTVFYFNVTNYEEVIDNSELTVKPVGATKDGENYVFASGEVAFDMFVKDMTKGDSLFVSIYTKEQYDTMGQVEPTKFAVADSVRFTTSLEKGEYVGDFTIVRKNDRGEDMVIGEAVKINFTVGTVANEAAELAGVNVYPNPNAGAFNVAVPERARIDIFGLNGAKVMSREVNAGVEAFNLDHSGIYFVRVMAGNKTAVKRVVVR